MSTTQVNVFGGGTGSITHDATTYNGVKLDRMDVTGPRGGRQTLWRAASKRNHQVASWSTSRADAAK